MTNLPEDFVPVYSLEGLAREANETAVTYTDALPGSYTLTLSNESKNSNGFFVGSSDVSFAHSDTIFR